MNLSLWLILIIAIIYASYYAINNYKKFSTIDWKFFCFLISIIILFPIIILILDAYNISNRFHWGINLDSSEWLNILFTYISSIIPALIGAFITIKSVKMSIENQEKIRKEDNKNQALPLLKISAKLGKKYTNKYIKVNCLLTKGSKKIKKLSSPTKMTIELTNIGMRELYDLYIGDLKSKVFKEGNPYYYKCTPVICKNEFMCFDIYFYEKEKYNVDDNQNIYDNQSDSIKFNCYFRDCYNNWYYQTLKINLIYHLGEDVPIDKPALYIFINSVEIVSPPMDIKENKLPWNNGKEIKPLNSRK